MATAPNIEIEELQGSSVQSSWNFEKGLSGVLCGSPPPFPSSGMTAATNMSLHQGSPAIRIEDDFHGWLLDQASALRERRYSALDPGHLVEELEAMAARERRELKNQLKRLLVHLLKLKVQPDARKRHHSWQTSVRNAREEIEDLLKDSPGIFAGNPDELLADVYKRAVRQATDETRLPESGFPSSCPWSFEQIMHEEFFAIPQPLEERR